jgi:hypothetical protein
MHLDNVMYIYVYYDSHMHIYMLLLLRQLACLIYTFNDGLRTYIVRQLA